MAPMRSSVPPSNPAAQLLSAPSTTTATTLTTSMSVDKSTPITVSSSLSACSNQPSTTSLFLDPARTTRPSPSLASTSAAPPPPTTATTTTTTTTTTTATTTATTATTSSSSRSPPSTSLPSSARTAGDQTHHVSEARAAIVASISNLLDSELQTRARTLHGNAAAITRQERDVGRATAALRVENDKLARWSADAARRVKELGSVQNWAEVLEREFLVLEETVRLVKEGSAESGSEGRGGEEDEEEGEEGSEASWCSGSCCRSRRGSGRLGKGGDAAVDELRGKGKRAEQDADGDVSMGDGSIRDGSAHFGAS